MPRYAINHGLKIRVSVVRFRDWPPEFQKPTALGWFFFACTPLRWRGSGSLPLEHTPAEITVSGAHSPICASLFSAALLNIQGTKSCIGAGFQGIGLFLRLLRARDRNRERQEERVSGRLERRESSVVQRASCTASSASDRSRQGM